MIEEKKPEYEGEPPGPNALEDPQYSKLPVLGQIIKPSKASRERMRKTAESKTNGAEGAKGKKLPAVKRTEDMFKNKDLVPDLQESVDNASMKSPNSETRIQIQNRKQEGIDMAAKKKTAAKKVKAEKKEVAPGRERKLLLRLSNSEYEGLQKLSEKNGVPMAQCLRDGCSLK